MNTFSKEERLCSRKLIDLLFKNGSSFLLYPFSVYYLQIDRAEALPEKLSGKRTFPVQVVMNVSKKRYKRAVDRNLVKRRSREAYRLQKTALLYQGLTEKATSPEQEKLLLLSLQFVGKQIYDHTFFEKKMAAVFKKLLSLL